MKVIGTDNYDRDGIPDVLVAENMTPEEAEAKADRMNVESGYRDTYYKAVPDDYRLSRGMEDLV